MVQQTGTDVRPGIEPLTPTTSNKSLYRSEFGGLWTDRIDAEQLVESQLRSGRVTDREAEDLHFWIANGYVVKRQAVPHQILNRVEADIQDTIERRDRRVTFWDDAGKHERPIVSGDLERTESKLLDVHRS